MNESREKRHFSTLMRDANSAFLPTQETPDKPVRVGFILLEHFSMMAFTAAVDALVTANLVRTAPLFSFTTFGLNAQTVKSDLGIDISTNGVLDQLRLENAAELDVLIVCGGFRCSLTEHKPLTGKLKAAAQHHITLGGIWNGAIALAHAGLLDNHSCALHPDNHAFMREKFAGVRISDQVQVLEEQRITCAGPVSALEMMLRLIEKVNGKEITRAIREILSSDQVAEIGESKIVQVSDDPNLPESLRDLMQLMGSNIEDPLSLEELAACMGISRRQIERLFQNHLETSPGRYYLELRITHARRLLLQSNDSITNIALACGFVSSSHFSNCYKDYFGVSPTLAREKHRS